MNKKEIKEQLREICTAANSLAGALCSLQVRLSADIMLDDEVIAAEAKGGDAMFNVMHEPTFDDISHQVKKLVDDFYATHDKAARWRIAEHILLSMFGLAPEELNGIMEKEARNFNSVISAIQHGNEETTHHCGQDADMDDGHQPEGYTYKDLLGMEVIGIGGMASTCAHCSDNVDCVKVELVGGTYMCLRKPQQEEDVEPDQTSKSLEDVYRENMELVRRHSIEQSEANQRLVKAMKKAYEKEERPVISFDEEESNVMCDINRRVNEQNSSTYQDAFSDAVRDIKTNGATHFSCPFAVLQAQQEIKDAETIKRMRGVSSALKDYVGRITGKDRRDGLGKDQKADQ